MIKLELHADIFGDITLCHKKYFKSLGKEAHRICRLLIQDGDMPGKTPEHHIRKKEMQNKTFHGGINLPEENTSKRQGGRVIYLKENDELIKILYLGAGHKDRRYDDPDLIVQLIEDRYDSGIYKPYSDDIDFESL